MNHISAKNGDRHCIFKQVHALCKQNAFLIVFEFGTQFLKQYEQTNNDEQNVQNALLSKENETKTSFEDWNAMKAYVEDFGFEFVQRIMPDTFGDDFWILLFKKPKSAN